MNPNQLTIKGRGAADNPPNRFEPMHLKPELEDLPSGEEEQPSPQTLYLRDESRSILAKNDSPDIGFTYSINPYRGCEHGCIYCYARPTHEWLGFSSGLDFETRIMVKPEAGRLLREALASPKFEPECIAISGVTDCYQPVERKLRLTRQCLEVLHEAGNPCGIVTKSHLVTRDIDLLAEMAKRSLAVVYVSVTTLDPDLSRLMEPRAASPGRRLDAISALSGAGIPVGVMVAPIIPGLTDHEAPRILMAAGQAGARFGSYVPLRLPFQVKDLFADWLREHFPDRADKVLNRVRELRGGKLNDSEFGTRMTGTGVWADELRSVFELGRRRAGFTSQPRLSTEHFKRPQLGQMSLW